MYLFLPTATREQRRFHAPGTWQHCCALARRSLQVSIFVHRLSRVQVRFCFGFRVILHKWAPYRNTATATNTSHADVSSLRLPNAMHRFAESSIDCFARYLCTLHHAENTRVIGRSRKKKTCNERCVHCKLMTECGYFPRRALVFNVTFTCMDFKQRLRCGVVSEVKLQTIDIVV